MRRIFVLAQQGQFNAVGRNHLCVSEQAFLHACNQRFVGEVAATGGLDHRIGNQRDVRVVGEKIHQYIHHIGVAEGSGFDGMNGGVPGQAFQLLADDVRIRCGGVVDVPGVLHGQAGQHRQRVTAQGGHCLDISLDAGAAGGIQARNNQNVRTAVKVDSRAPQKGLTTARMTMATSARTGISLNQR